MDSPKKDECYKLHHSSHSQIKYDGEEEDDTANTISDVTKSTGLGDMAKDVMDKISIYEPKRTFTMFQTMIE